jgi:hypothetical protein
MVPALAQVARENFEGLRDIATKFGALQSLTFKRVAPTGMDFYEAKFATGAREFGVLLQADGRIFAAL